VTALLARFAGNISRLPKNAAPALERTLRNLSKHRRCKNQADHLAYLRKRRFAFFTVFFATFLAFLVVLRAAALAFFALAATFLALAETFFDMALALRCKAFACLTTFRFVAGLGVSASFAALAFTAMLPSVEPIDSATLVKTSSNCSGLSVSAGVILRLLVRHQSQEIVRI
jgi:hypothetical protein